MVKYETLEPLSKEEIINLFVEYSQNVNRLIGVMQEEIRVLKEEVGRLKRSKTRPNSSSPPSHDFGKPPQEKSLCEPNGKKNRLTA